MKRTAVIMAGGKGERFWPMSRSQCPKQFLSLTSDGETMIQKTVKRLQGIAEPEDIFIITNASYLELVFSQLPEIPRENVIAEPCPRNTAPCIGLAAAVIAKKYGDAVMLVLPSDHLIQSVDMYRDTLLRAAETAEEGENLVTLGITPVYPETGYGYIRYVQGSGRHGIYAVEKFVEKPDEATAREYLQSGGYLWNSGMFIWKTSSILANLARFMPVLSEGLQPIAAAFGTPDFTEILNEAFPGLPAESIDVGIMEKADSIFTIPGNFGWDDVGSWLALQRCNPLDDAGNLFRGDVVAADTRTCTVIAGSRTIALVGMENTVVVDTEDALLICSKGSTQNIKAVLAEIRKQGRTELL